MDELLSKLQSKNLQVAQHKGKGATGLHLCAEGRGYTTASKLVKQHTQMEDSHVVELHDSPGNRCIIAAVPTADGTDHDVRRLIKKILETLGKFNEGFNEEWLKSSPLGKGLFDTFESFPITSLDPKTVQLACEASTLSKYPGFSDFPLGRLKMSGKSFSDITHNDQKWSYSHHFQFHDMPNVLVHVFKSSGGHALFMEKREHKGVLAERRLPLTESFLAECQGIIPLRVIGDRVFMKCMHGSLEDLVMKVSTHEASMIVRQVMDVVKHLAAQDVFHTDIDTSSVVYRCMGKDRAHIMLNVNSLGVGSTSITLRPYPAIDYGSPVYMGTKTTPSQLSHAYKRKGDAYIVRYPTRELWICLEDGDDLVSAGMITTPVHETKVIGDTHPILTEGSLSSRSSSLGHRCRIHCTQSYQLANLFFSLMGHGFDWVLSSPISKLEDLKDEWSKPFLKVMQEVNDLVKSGREPTKECLKAHFQLWESGLPNVELKLLSASDLPASLHVVV